MAHEAGNISVSSENIFPIIKKWLYSDRDIFLRELVSNCCDAISKLKKLDSIGEIEIPEGTKFQVKVIYDKDNETLKFVDNGIGMTADEVKKYINQVAFSGAEEFLQKYKDKNDENLIIGHFGLGFYSAFMVADKVEIDTLSYKKDGEAVKWECNGGTEYEMSSSDKTQVGTTITLHISEDSKEFLEEHRLREILHKYCYFLPYEIYIENANPEKEEENKTNEEKSKEEKPKEEKQEPKPVNNTHPLWLKRPADCKEEEYKEFYKEVFFDFTDPLFWIHLNVEYPFKLKGILYFPKLKHEFDAAQGQIKLYNNQVFVADNVKEVIPEFLMLLKGTIDCPDIPLNVSRSFLQNDGYVRKISAHITKKVADKLKSIYNTNRENYNKYWDDINPFVKFGCMRDEKFYEKVKDIMIFKTTNDEYVTLQDYLDKNKVKHENKVFYVTDEKQQAQYVKIFKENDMEAVILPSMIDTHFIQFLEMKNQNVKFNRIDSDISDSLKENDEKNNEDALKQTKEVLEKEFKEALNNDKIKIQVEALKSENIPAMILLSEQSRRFKEISRSFGGMMNMPGAPQDEQTLVLNKNNKIIQLIISYKDRLDMKDDMKLICQQVYDLAMLSHKQLEPNEMTTFIERSNVILTKLAEVNAD